MILIRAQFDLLITNNHVTPCHGLHGGVVGGTEKRVCLVSNKCVGPVMDRRPVQGVPHLSSDWQLG